MPVWRAAARYAGQDIPVVIVAGERYARVRRATGPPKAQMLGAKAVLAASFERIHRSNLIGMGVLPLRLPEGWAEHAADRAWGRSKSISTPRRSPRARFQCACGVARRAKSSPAKPWRCSTPRKTWSLSAPAGSFR